MLAYMASMRSDPGWLGRLARGISALALLIALVVGAPTLGSAAAATGADSPHSRGQCPSFNEALAKVGATTVFGVGECHAWLTPSAPGSAVSVKVPPGALYAGVIVDGATGGNAGAPGLAAGGRGAELITILRVKPGSRLYPWVGAAGTPKTDEGGSGGGLSAVCTKQAPVEPAQSSSVLGAACPVVAGGGGGAGAAGAVFSRPGLVSSATSYIAGGNGGDAGPSPTPGRSGTNSPDASGGGGGQPGVSFFGSVHATSLITSGQGGAPTGSNAAYGQAGTNGCNGTGIGPVCGGVAITGALAGGGGGGEGIVGGAGGGAGGTGYDSNPESGPTTGRQGGGGGGGGGGSYVKVSATSGPLEKGRPPYSVAVNTEYTNGGVVIEFLKKRP